MIDNRRGIQAQEKQIFTGAMIRWVCPVCRRSEHLGDDQEYTCTCGTERSLEAEEIANDFMHALADSEADVGNFSAGMFVDEVRVQFDIHEPDDSVLVAEVADEHGFEKINQTATYRVDS